MSYLMKLVLIISAVWPAFIYAECNTALVSNKNSDRYEVQTDGTVLDKITHLTWQRCPVGYVWSSINETCNELENEDTLFTWQQALQYAAQLDGQWRLPSSKELESLIKRNCFQPAIETHIFSNLALSYMWSSTPAVNYFGNAWAIQFSNGGVVSVAKEGRYQVRLLKRGDE